jgi:hypothetical protein
MNTPGLPFPRSYWVEPHKLLAGCHPGDTDPALTDAKLRGLVQCGVGVILNLMEEEERDYLGRLFPDYEPALRRLAAAANRLLKTRRMPIRDCDIPTEAHMKDILDFVDAEISQGKIVFVHCLGGIGRTGTVVGCYLARHGIAAGPAALHRLAELTKHAKEAFWPTPQTPAQCAFVWDWREGT